MQGWDRMWALVKRGQGWAEGQGQGQGYQEVK